MQKITFILPSRNNLEFLKLAYKSIRELKYVHEILILDDASKDGTKDWVNSLNDSNLLMYYNPGPDRIGIVGMFDKGIELATTEIVFAFHADMIASPNLDINILKHLRPGTVVCATRIEPPLHPPGPEKIILNWGVFTTEYDYETNKNTFLSLESQNTGRTTNGIFAPWCMYKEDYVAIGGHDVLFAPQSKEDSDLFNRFVLKGYTVIQSWDALVYHFTSRGSRFNSAVGGAPGTDSNEWIHTTTKNMRNFVRKWGTVVKHDKLMLPIISHKYNIHAIIHNCSEEHIDLLEPWFSCVYISTDLPEIGTRYINKEQPNTKFNLLERVKLYIPEQFSMDNIDVLVEFDASKLRQESFNIIQNMSGILTDSGEIGEFELDIFRFTITSLKTYEHDLIYLPK